MKLTSTDLLEDANRQQLIDFNNLDYPIAQFSYDEDDILTLRDLVRGVQIFGSIGSGKSSGSGQYFAKSFLRRGYGGIVLAAKKDEVGTWKKYVSEVKEDSGIDREDDLIIFSPDYTYEFNPLEYMKQAGGGFSKTDNIVNFFTSIIKMGDRINGGGSGGSKDPFWDLALNRIMKSSIDLLKCANEDITIANISKIIQEAPEEKGLFNSFKNAFEKMISGESDEENGFLIDKYNQSYTYLCIIESLYRRESKDLNQSEIDVLEVSMRYFLIDFPNIPENTRGSILETFYAFSNPFRAGILADYFSRGVTKEVRPEYTFEGKIIIINFAVKEYLQLGVYAQSIYKKVWQQVVERREVNKHPRPVFMWVDEAQYFINEDDTMFQTTARSVRACTVLITQNISNYYAAIGGQNPQARVDSLLGNLVTKIFHTNNDHVTNEWAAKTIGKVYQTKETINFAEEGSISTSDILDYQVQPQEFTLLKAGGGGLNVQAVVTTAGKTWSNGRNYIKVAFEQNSKKKVHSKRQPWIIKMISSTKLYKSFSKNTD